MTPTGLTEEHLAVVVLIVFVTLVLARVWQWFRGGARTPDPWSDGINAELETSDAPPLCHRCLTPHSAVTHFCPECGASVGDCNNLMPFERLFSEGEVFRNGTSLRLPKRPTV